MGLIKNLVVLGAGYVLGTRAGRERYEQIKEQATKLWESSTVQAGREKARETASETFNRASEAASARARETFAAASEKVKNVAQDLRDRGSANAEANLDNEEQEIIVEALSDEA
ncbi:MAG: hypothetical protein SPG61_06820 [Arcanobacterium sp.]|nr:hypothetical protein [Arcanobacterium sp.]